MTALQAYVLAKKIAESSASGISNITFSDNTLTFILKDGSQLNMEVPLPKDGISITKVEINNAGHLICTMSNGEINDAGLLPSDSEGNSLNWKFI